MADLIPNNEEDLTDDKLEQLLKSAEARIKSSQSPATSSFRLPKLNPGIISQPLITLSQGIARADSSRLLNNHERELAGHARLVKYSTKAGAKLAKKTKSTAGSDWFDLPRTNLTPELKRDLQLLKMRSVIDPKRHYKKESNKVLAPEFSQVGTIVESPTEYYSSRLLNRDRKNTFVDQILAAEKSTGRFTSKYNDVQITKTSGKKAYYKKLMKKRDGGVRKR